MLSNIASAGLILDSVWGDIRGIDADGVASVSDSTVEFTHSEFGFDNDIWTVDFSTNGLFTLKVDTVGPFGNIGGGDGSQWFFNNFSLANNPIEEIIDVRLVDFYGESFSDPLNISFTKDSITIVMNNLGLDASIPSNTFTSGTFQIITSTSVPEPSSILMFALVLMILVSKKVRNFL